MLLPHAQNLFDMEISVLEFSCGQLESFMNNTCTLMWTYEESITSLFIVCIKMRMYLLLS